MSNENQFKLWAVIELFGHNKVAGFVTEQQIGGASFIRVDIPATATVAAYTKYYHPNAVYAITPVSEETATRAAHHIDQAPVRTWELRLPEPQVNAVQESYIGDDSELDGFEDETF